MLSRIDSEPDMLLPTTLSQASKIEMENGVPPSTEGKRASNTRCPVNSGVFASSFWATGLGDRTGHACSIVYSCSAASAIVCKFCNVFSAVGCAQVCSIVYALQGSKQVLGLLVLCARKCAGLFHCSRDNIKLSLWPCSQQSVLLQHRHCLILIALSANVLVLSAVETTSQKYHTGHDC